jgi:DnaJ-class molecular chaperone
MLNKCVYCEGSGQARTTGRASNVCPVCNGVGKIEIPQNHVECAYCRGKGVTNVTPGKGSVDHWGNRWPCPTCGGTGVAIPPKYG